MVLFPLADSQASLEDAESCLCLIDSTFPLLSTDEFSEIEWVLFMTDQLKCWICGGDADSREHLVKASDLKSMFGAGVTQSTPLYFHDSRSRNQPVGGYKSKKLKYSPLICSDCNNVRTQSHDYAWEKLSEYLRTRNPPLRGGSTVKLSKVFTGRVRTTMLAVHLFFVKQFGCLIAQEKIPIPLEPFSKAILNCSPHPNVFIGFWTGLGPLGRKFAGRTQVEAALVNGQVAYAAWFYHVGPIAVNVIYSLPGEQRVGLTRSWHPSFSERRIVISES